MNIPIRVRTLLMSCALVSLSFRAFAQPDPPASAPNPSAQHDGQHDFDWEIGAWKIYVRRLQHPLTGSTSWAEYDGTLDRRKDSDGRRNLAEIKVDGPAGHIDLLSLRPST